MAYLLLHDGPQQPGQQGVGRGAWVVDWQLCDDVRTRDLDASRRFYTEMFGWPVIESPAGPVLGDGSGPWGGFTPLAEGDPRHAQWIPYVPVADVDAAAAQAVALGALPPS
jgi:predicted enzyme related to lactoylglutathione lyase